MYLYFLKKNITNPLLLIFQAITTYICNYFILTEVTIVSVVFTLSFVILVSPLFEAFVFKSLKGK